MKTQDADSDERRDEWKSMELAILACNCAAQHSNAWPYQENQVYSGVTVCSTSLCWELNIEQLQGILQRDAIQINAV